MEGKENVTLWKKTFTVWIGSWEIYNLGFRVWRSLSSQCHHCGKMGLKIILIAVHFCFKRHIRIKVEYSTFSLKKVFNLTNEGND